MIVPVLLLRLAIVVLAMVGMATVQVVGRPRSLHRRSGDDVRERAFEFAPSLALLGVVLAVNSVARRVGPDVSWVVGWHVTDAIYEIEGAFVAGIQSIASPPLTAYFSATYVYGYVFLLVFPFVAYAVLDDPTPFRETAIAYALNYAIGLACYLLFIAHGPRNFAIGVEGLLYSSWPQSQLLTSQVNANTNVFPSLHASLSATVVLMAYRTRDRYPRWLLLSVPIAASVAVSTMYLGIHWAIDVLAGLLLALVSVRQATDVRLPNPLVRR